VPVRKDGSAASTIHVSTFDNLEFFAGFQRDSQLRKAAYLQATSGVVHLGKKSYHDMKAGVARAIAAYGISYSLTYLRAIGLLSHA
jgi:hypothetical protein